MTTQYLVYIKKVNTYYCEIWYYVTLFNFGIIKTPAETTAQNYHKIAL